LVNGLGILRIDLGLGQVLLDAVAVLDLLATVSKLKALATTPKCGIFCRPAGRYWSRKRTSRGDVLLAKYRHPETGAAWSGRGLKPKWLVEQLSHGKKVSDFAI